jgi:chorismate synthase
LHAELGKAMLSINAVKGFEYGSGFCGAQMKGSEHNDLHIRMELQKRIFPAVFRNQQWYGHFFRVAFKPVATIMQKQESLDNQGTLRK